MASSLSWMLPLQALGVDPRDDVWRQERLRHIVMRPFVDMWGDTLCHTDYSFALACLTRNLIACRPNIIRAQPANNANVLVKSHLTDLWKSSGDRANVVAEFLKGKSLKDLAVLHACLSIEAASRREQLMDDWQDCLGKIVIVPYGDSDDNWALCVLKFDSGALKYRPKVADIVSQIQGASGYLEVRLEELQRSVPRPQGQSRGQWCQAFRAAALLALDSDLMEIGRLVNEYSRLSRWLSSRQGLGESARRNAVEQAGESTPRSSNVGRRVGGHYQALLTRGKPNSAERQAHLRKTTSPSVALNHPSSSRVPPITVSDPVSVVSTSAPPLRPFSTTLNAVMQRAKYKKKIEAADVASETARPYPVDGGIVGDDAIGQQLLHLAKSKADGTERDARELCDEPDGFTEFMRRLRVREKQVDFADGDLSIASQVAVDLFELARQPLVLKPALLPSFRFAGRVHDQEANRNFESAPSDEWSLYIRSRRFDNPRLLEAEAKVYMKDFPADADFATLVI